MLKEENTFFDLCHRVIAPQIERAWIGTVHDLFMKK